MQIPWKRQEKKTRSLWRLEASTDCLKILNKEVHILIHSINSHAFYLLARVYFKPIATNQKEQTHLYTFASQSCFEQSKWAEKTTQLLVLLK